MTQRQQIAMSLFVAEGYDPTGAAALVGNFCQESGPNLNSGYTAKTDHGSQGIAQWREDRLTALEDFCASKNLHSGTLAAQVKFAIYELGKVYPDLDKALRAGGDIDKLTTRVCWEYERPNKNPKISKIVNRIKYAHLAFNAYVAASGAHTEPAQAQATIGAAKKTAETHQANAGAAVLLAGLLGFFHTMLQIPTPILISIFGILALGLIYSINQAGKAKTVVATTSVNPAPAPAASASVKPMAPVDPGPPPTGPLELIYVESLDIWVQGVRRAPVLAPAPAAAEAPPVHMLSIAPADMDLLADKIVAKMLAPAHK